ncbi:MAG: D-arabinono-1,4-lactone oxidase, partial [Caldilineaceae bacterium]
YRTLAADDIWLGPAYGRDTVTISVHQAAELPYRPFFDDVETIFRNYGGRPHWGKIHTHGAAELAALYPQWDAFQQVRRQLDPQGRFLNDYLRQLFEVA